MNKKIELDIEKQIAEIASSKAVVATSSELIVASAFSLPGQASRRMNEILTFRRNAKIKRKTTR